MPAARRGARKLAQQQLEEAARHRFSLPQAVVQSIATGAGRDGHDKVTVSWNGASLALPHVPFYTPVVGDVVALVPYAGTWMILGPGIGWP